MNRGGVIACYREFLPVTDKTPVVTLLEGNTPLIPAPSLEALVGPRSRVWLKYGANPTGSFKDRGMTVAVSKALESGSEAVMCASTGNTSASASAYAARAGISCFVVIPAGAIALGKLAQALVHGAKVLPVDGNFDDALRLVREITDEYPVTLVNSLNPYRIQGQKTASFEICDVLGDAPDFHVLPVGNAGNITAYWLGYGEYSTCGKSTKKPAMLGFQAAGAAPIVEGRVFEKPETIATAIRIGNPASWQSAVDAASQSNGFIRKVTDEEILQAYDLIASGEGVFAEPASAASVAGLVLLCKEGFFRNWAGEGPRIVCTLTGHGLKDPDRAIAGRQCPEPFPASKDAVLKAMGL